MKLLINLQLLRYSMKDMIERQREKNMKCRVRMRKKDSFFIIVNCSRPKIIQEHFEIDIRG